MRIGLVGVGRIGAFHASILSGFPAVDSLVVADADGARARKVAERLGLDVAASLETLVKPGLDALVIASPNQAHPELIVRGAGAGLPPRRGRHSQFARDLPPRRRAPFPSRKPEDQRRGTRLQAESLPPEGRL